LLKIEKKEFGRTCNGHTREMHTNIIGNHEVKKPRMRTKRRWEDKTKWILKKQGVSVWTRLNWLRVSLRGGISWKVMNTQVP
jgi:hypothetical protein